MSSFKDHFSSASDRYAAYRPDYPRALLAWLAGLCPRPVTRAERDTACESSLDLPLAEIQDTASAIEIEWALPRLMDDLSTWSAVKRYQAAPGGDPLPALMAELQPSWGNPEAARTLQWPLFLRVGRR